MLEHSTNIRGCLRLTLRDLHWDLVNTLWHLETTIPMNSSALHPHVSHSLRNSSTKVLINLYKLSDGNWHSSLASPVASCDDSVFIIDIRFCLWSDKGEQRTLLMVLTPRSALSVLCRFSQASTAKGKEKCQLCHSEDVFVGFESVDLCSSYLPMLFLSQLKIPLVFQLNPHETQ